MSLAVTSDRTVQVATAQRILVVLRESKSEWFTAKGLAVELGCTIGTVYRYMWPLWRAGLVVYRYEPVIASYKWRAIR